MLSILEIGRAFFGSCSVPRVGGGQEVFPSFEKSFPRRKREALAAVLFGLFLGTGLDERFARWLRGLLLRSFFSADTSSYTSFFTRLSALPTYTHLHDPSRCTTLSPEVCGLPDWNATPLQRAFFFSPFFLRPGRNGMMCKSASMLLSRFGLRSSLAQFAWRVV
eukprot:RCo002555